ncbi:MAG TPA: DUF2844 domain-containing protein [Anaeromyxobacteraceae bacterium]|nr:DUF2844 domain-containing protein [Anaeromyxobacteraceae bacterium]
MRGRLQMLLLAAALVAAAPARASLGGKADSVEADRKALSAARRATVARAGYTVEEVDTGAVRVREYVSPSGVVFAVAWNGLAHPDLDTLLGSYAAAWRQADRQVPRTPGRRSRAVRTPRLVVERWGHMRDWQGRAYDPALLPAGVSVDEIR